MNEPWLSFIFIWTQRLSQKSHVTKSSFQKSVRLANISLLNRIFIQLYGFSPIASVRPAVAGLCYAEGIQTLLWERVICGTTGRHNQVSWKRSNRTTGVLLQPPLPQQLSCWLPWFHQGGHLTQLQQKQRSWGGNQLVCLVLEPNVLKCWIVYTSKMYSK